MKLAVLPFNAAEGASPELSRQLANFVSDTMRAGTGAEVNTVSLLTQVEQDGVPRAALVNFSDGLLERQFIDDLFKQSQADLVVDGLLEAPGPKTFRLTVRFHRAEEEAPLAANTYDFGLDGAFEAVRQVVAEVAARAEVAPSDGVDFGNLDFGTDKPEVFLDFLKSYDALMYIQQANGRVVKEFTPLPAIDSLVADVEADPDFEGPYQTLVGLCRACAANRLGTFEALEAALLAAQRLRPDDFTAYFGLGEVYQSVNDAGRAADQYEKAIQAKPDDASLYVRLGMAQMAGGMPVNAERNFRKAMELEGDDKPSTDFLASVLAQTNREHEIPALWKALIDKNPQNAQAHAKYAIALVQAGRAADAEAAFERGLATLEDAAVVKRYYAPLLAQKGELDRAMDFYEDCLDVSPNEIPVLLEYARTLQQADRTFEIPEVLKTVLGSNPDPNTRAQALAWLIELEQPKRVEGLENARMKLEAGDSEGAVRDLKPLRNWLADYWKLWALLSAAYNRLNDPKEAEDAARRLLALFPGCEPAYGELVTALQAQDRDDEAYQLMRFAAANIPNSLPVHVNLMRAAHGAGHLEEARAIARQLREVVPAEGLKELEPLLADIEA